MMNVCYVLKLIQDVSNAKFNLQIIVREKLSNIFIVNNVHLDIDYLIITYASNLFAILLMKIIINA